MSGSKGFTLLELLFAITVVVVGFSVLFELISKARLDYTNSERLHLDLVQLNNMLLEGKTEGLSHSKSALKDYPEIEEISYRLGSAELLIYQLRR